MRVEFQRRQLEFPTAQFGYLRDSTDALEDIEELRRRIAADGYLFIRGLIDRDAVLEACRAVMEHLQVQDAPSSGGYRAETTREDGHHGVRCPVVVSLCPPVEGLQPWRPWWWSWAGDGGGGQGVEDAGGEGAGDHGAGGRRLGMLRRVGDLRSCAP